MFCVASVCKSLPPAGTTMSRSPLMFIVTSPLLTSQARASRMTTASTSTTAVNMAMAMMNSCMFIEAP